MLSVFRQLCSPSSAKTPLTKTRPTPIITGVKVRYLHSSGGRGKGEIRQGPSREPKRPRIRRRMYARELGSCVH